MQRGKILIVFILLFSYTFGFAHNIIPHCDTDHSESSCFSNAHELTHEHEGHHQHNDNELASNDHNHIPHSNHFDDNLLEYVKCLFESPAHGNDLCSMDNIAHTQNDNEVKIDDLKFLAVFCSLFELKLIEKNDIQNHFEHLNIDSSYKLERNPLRGPPLA